MATGRPQSKEKDRIVYVGSAEGGLYALDAGGCGSSVCQPLWIGQAPGPISAMDSPPMVANGVVYVGENNNRIYGFPARGCGSTVCNRIWEYLTQDPIVNTSPAMVNGTLYVGGSNFGTTPELYVLTLPG